MKLALFFTRGISLEYWLNSGLFDREKLIYEEHLRRQTLSEVFWFTYGVRDAGIASDLQKQGRLEKRINVIGMPKYFRGKIGVIIYSLLLPFIRYRQIRKADVLKTNQADGSWSAVIARLLFGKPLIARTGYALSFALCKNGCSLAKLKSLELAERMLYRSADIAIVSAKHNEEYVANKYGIPEGKIAVLRNYVDTDRFRPLDCPKYTDRIVFVGRLSEEKNLSNLIDAVCECNLTLDIYGKGELEGQLRAEAKSLGARVHFKGLAANDELPRVLNRYRYYILPSLYEGMPKSLLEAMACGLVCIGTDVEGISEVIRDQVNGYLCGTSAESISKAISKARCDPCANVDISNNAREAIVANCSLEKIIEKEVHILMAWSDSPE